MPKINKPLSEAQLAANRANSKKSTGPKTTEGKAKSALNSLRHGAHASNSTLNMEHQADFIAIHQGFEATFQPQNEAEFCAIEEYSALHWRLIRLRAVQNRMLDDACHPGTAIDDAVTPVVEGYKSLHGEDTYQLNHRNETRLSRMKARALDEFLKIRAFTEKYPPAHATIYATNELVPVEQYSAERQTEIPATPSGTSIKNFQTKPFRRPIFPPAEPGHTTSNSPKPLTALVLTAASAATSAPPPAISWRVSKSA